MKPEPLATCPKCKGSGEVFLPPPIRSTFRRFSRRGARLTAGDIQEMDRREENVVTINAINNRLERLRRMGLLKRVRDGKRWIYSKPKDGESTEGHAPPRKSK